jgi:20S proteasome alpha/beta subunit
MESIIALVGNGFVLFAGDKHIAHSIVMMSDSHDKLMTLDDNKIIAAVGDQGDTSQFTEYIQKVIRKKNEKNEKKSARN